MGRPKGSKHSEETKKKMSMAHSGSSNHFFGRTHSEETKLKISLANKGKTPWSLGKKLSPEHIEKLKGQRPNTAGEKNHNWISDRTKLAKRQERNDMAYKEWRRQVWLRDNFTCKIANPDCAGRIEAHHILGWSSHPELRYQPNNGITLCHFHHPRRREDEKRLEAEFQALVSVSKV